MGNCFSRTKATPEKGKERSKSQDDSIHHVPMPKNEYSKYGITSSPKGKYSQGLPSAEKQAKEEGFGNPARLMNREKARALAYLYGRGFCAKMRRETRREVIQKMLGNAALTRLTRVIQAGGDKDITLNNDALYFSTCRSLQLYFRQEGAFGFRQNSDENGNWFLRVQSQGNCFIQAPCVMAAYLLHDQGFTHAAPIDACKFIQRTFSDRRLYKYCVKDAGGFSCGVLKDILETLSPREKGKQILLTFPTDEVKKQDFDLEDLLKTCGPGLVSGFQTNKKFCQGSSDGKTTADNFGYVQFFGRSHFKGRFIDLQDDGDEEARNAIAMAMEEYRSSSVEATSSIGLAVDNGEDKSNTSGSLSDDSSCLFLDSDDDGEDDDRRHAMIVVGGRRDKQQKLWLLLQNSWTHMPLVEVSAEYFWECNASLSFVSDTFQFPAYAMLNPEKSYEMNCALVAEINSLDRADNAKGCYSNQTKDRL